MKCQSWSRKARFSERSLDHQCWGFLGRWRFLLEQIFQGMFRRFPVLDSMTRSVVSETTLILATCVEFIHLLIAQHAH